MGTPAPRGTRSAVARLSAAQARRVALAAQGFTDPRPAVPTMRTFTRTLARTGVLQVDSVNVLTRAHYMPLYSRMGPYDVDLLHRAAHRRPRRVVEYWAHVQAFMPVELWPVMRHRMESHRTRRHKWFGGEIDEALLDGLLARIAERGASTARDLDAGSTRRQDHWGWNWSVTRRALDYLVTVGDVAVAARNRQFEICYDLPERVLPAAVLAAPTPSPAQAARALVGRAARSHGIATAADLADYYRMRLRPDRHGGAVAEDARGAIVGLVADGELEPVRVEGWSGPAYLHRDARRPRRVRARALLSPFDPLVWQRERTERLFGFRYRIEIYTPRAQRVHGYYVLPFLLDEAIVARVDLKADRPRGVLVVRGAFAEPGAPAGTASELAAELGLLAGWLGLAGVEVADHGDLAGALGRAVAGRERRD